MRCTKLDKPIRISEAYAVATHISECGVLMNLDAFVTYWSDEPIVDEDDEYPHGWITEEEFLIKKRKLIISKL